MISRTVKNIPILTPQQWATVVRGARRGKHLYIVRELTPSGCFDFKQHSVALKQFERDENADRVEWMKIKSPRIIREKSDSLQLRYDFDQNYVKVDLFLGHRKIRADCSLAADPKRQSRRLKREK